jgi:hypothetical protein
VQYGGARSDDMIKGEHGRHANAADVDDGARSGNGTLESIPEVSAPPLLARGARDVLMVQGSGDDGRTGDEDDWEGGAEGEEARKKRKRNKPTLSCGECVERKTKVCSMTRVFRYEVSLFDCMLRKYCMSI